MARGGVEDPWNEFADRSGDLMADDHLYVIRCGDYCKVGRAAKPSKRFQVVLCSNPYATELVFQRAVPYPGIAGAEERAHEILAGVHHRGEWFACAPTVAIAAVERAIDEVSARLLADYSPAAVQQRYEQDRADGLAHGLARKLEEFRRSRQAAPRPARRASIIADRAKGG